MPDRIVAVIVASAAGTVAPGPGQTSADVPARTAETENK